MYKVVGPLGLVAIVSTTIVPTALAEPIAGQMQIAGSFALSSTFIDFLPGGGSTGSFTIAAGTASFAIVVGGVGTLRDILYSATNQTSFLTFAAGPSTRFDLTGLLPGIYGSAACSGPAAAGQVCTPAGSVLSLANLSATMSTLSFAGTGSFVNGNDMVPYTVKFTATIPNIPYQVVLTTFASGGSFTSSYSAIFAPVASVPEPDTYIMLAAGLALLGTALWRQNTRLPS